MAKIKDPLLSGGASGKIGESLIFSMRASGPQVRTQRTPTGARSVAQVARNQEFSAAAAAWGLLSVGEKEVYSTLAAPFNLTGYNLYLSVYVPGDTLAILGLAILGLAVFGTES